MKLKEAFIAKTIIIILPIIFHCTLWHSAMHEVVWKITEYKRDFFVMGLQNENRLLCKFTNYYKSFLEWCADKNQ